MCGELEKLISVKHLIKKWGSKIISVHLIETERLLK